jgi:hypothetical protein
MGGRRLALGEVIVQKRQLVAAFATLAQLAAAPEVRKVGAMWEQI